MTVLPIACGPGERVLRSGLGRSREVESRPRGARLVVAGLLAIPSAMLIPSVGDAKPVEEKPAAPADPTTEPSSEEGPAETPPSPEEQPPPGADRPDDDEIPAWLYDSQLADRDPSFEEEEGNRRVAPTRRRDGWVWLPGGSYTPEHGLSVAGAVLRYFRVGRRDARASRVGLTVEASYDKRGIVSLDPDLWLFGGRVNLAGTAWMSYLDYPYFGVGNDTALDAREDYTALRAVGRLEAIARVSPDLYAGGLYELRHMGIENVEEGGELASDGVFGSNGGRSSAVGLIARYDSRDHGFLPRSGGVVTLSPRLYNGIFGSDFDFMRIVAEAAWFVGLGGQHVLAAEVKGDFRSGDAPFDLLGLAGGNRLLRGMLEGRFRDKHFIGGQVEYRYPIYWRFSGVAFGGLGRVADLLSAFAFEDLKYSYGGGLRFAVAPGERITIRFDYGFSNDTSSFYFALLEAF